MTGFGVLAAVLISAVLLALALVAFRALRLQRLMQEALAANPPIAAEGAPAPDGIRLSGLAHGYELIESRHGPMLVNSKDRYLGQAVIAYGECCELEVGP